mmetsp:Transcript_112710/g.313583  ORF Transcript_112710/g.313583 Transcript_112710/m.313583 type:complete len:353 (-) Transcript_112710:393-1451(-)
MTPMMRFWSNTCRIGTTRSDLMVPTALSSTGSDMVGITAVPANCACAPWRAARPTTPLSHDSLTPVSPGPTLHISWRTSSTKKTEQDSERSTLPTSCAMAWTYSLTVAVGDDKTMRNLIRGRYSRESSTACSPLARGQEMCACPSGRRSSTSRPARLGGATVRHLRLERADPPGRGSTGGSGGASLELSSSRGGAVLDGQDFRSCDSEAKFGSSLASGSSASLTCLLGLLRARGLLALWACAEACAASRPEAAAPPAPGPALASSGSPSTSEVLEKATRLGRLRCRAACFATAAAGGVNGASGARVFLYPLLGLYGASSPSELVRMTMPRCWVKPPPGYPPLAGREAPSVGG